jgi:predicted RNA polymerase sigma factor
VRGDLLQRLGRPGEAAAAFREAADLSQNAGERALLLERAERCRVEC